MSENGSPATVLFFHISSGSFGGGEQMLLRLLTSLNRDRIRPVLLTQQFDELSRRAKADGVDVRDRPFDGVLDTHGGELLSVSPLRTVAVAGRILQYNVGVGSTLREADVVWCKNLRAVLTLFPFLLLTRTPVVWNIGLGRKSEGMVKYLNRIALEVVDYVFIESETQARRVFTDGQYERHEGKFVIFNKGIDTERFSPPERPVMDAEETSIGVAAILNPRKGIDDFLTAAAGLLERHESLQFHVAGEPVSDADEAYAERLREQVRRAGIEDDVTFHGWIEEMPSYYEALDVFVLPSLNEGIPGAVREALSMERPVVATDVGGTSDVVRDGKTGLLVPPGDPDALVEAIDTLIEDRTMAREMGTEGRDVIVEEFSLESYVSRYQEFLARVSPGENP